jgi:hypothetical protein
MKEYIYPSLYICRFQVPERENLAALLDYHDTCVKLLLLLVHQWLRATKEELMSWHLDAEFLYI